MSLRHAVLAALLEGEASGYNSPSASTCRSPSSGPPTPQQLYRELERLEQARPARRGPRGGAATAPRTSACSRSPARADEELLAFTGQPASPTAMRDELLVQVQAADAGDPEAIRKAAAVRLEQSYDKLARYDRLREPSMLDGQEEDDYLRDSERIGPYLAPDGRSNVRAGEHPLVPSRPPHSRRAPGGNGQLRERPQGGDVRTRGRGASPPSTSPSSTSSPSASSPSGDAPTRTVSARPSCPSCAASRQARGPARSGGGAGESGARPSDRRPTPPPLPGAGVGPALAAFPPFPHVGAPRGSRKGRGRAIPPQGSRSRRDMLDVGFGGTWAAVAASGRSRGRGPRGQPCDRCCPVRCGSFSTRFGPAFRRAERQEERH